MTPIRRRVLRACLPLWLAASTLWAQPGEDLYLYGYQQSLFYQRNSTFRTYPAGGTVPEPIAVDTRVRTFALQQLNLFLLKPYGERSTLFVNLEFQNSFSTSVGSGDFNVQEGWVGYRVSDALHLKAGLLLPVFNNLNEVQNRLPLFPYVIRPVVYEVLVSNQFALEDYVPERAFLQLSGMLPLGDLRLDYAVHVGNSETSFLDTSGTVSADETSGVNLNLYRGEDVTSFKAVGGRLGVHTPNEGLKTGVSFTYDRDNRRQATERSISRLPGAIIPALGDIPRTRLGLDLSAFRGPFAFEGELIRVFHDMSGTAFPDLSLDKRFVYGTVSYESAAGWFVYGGSSFINDDSYEASQPNSVDEAGATTYTVGGGYRLSHEATTKLQFKRFAMGDNPYLDGRFDFFLVALSLTF